MPRGRTPLSYCRTTEEGRNDPEIRKLRPPRGLPARRTEPGREPSAVKAEDLGIGFELEGLETLDRQRAEAFGLGDRAVGEQVAEPGADEGMGVEGLVGHGVIGDGGGASGGALGID